MGHQQPYPGEQCISVNVTLIREIVYEIAEREGVEPVNLDPTLGEVMNTDLLDAIADVSNDGVDSLSLTLDFEYQGYMVSIDSDGEVHISDPSESSTEQPRTGPSRPLEPSATETTARQRAMKNVADIIAARDRPFADRLDGLLHVVRNTLNLDAATLSYVENGTYVFESVDVAENVDIQVGEVVSLGDTVCKRVVESEQALVLRDVEADAPELTESALEVASYLGVPVFVDGRVYGTFCFYDAEPRTEEFSDWEFAFVELLSNWVSSELERRQREWLLQRQSSDRPQNMS